MKNFNLFGYKITIEKIKIKNGDLIFLNKKLSKKLAKTYQGRISREEFVKILQQKHKEKYNKIPTLIECKVFADKYIWKDYKNKENKK